MQKYLNHIRGNIQQVIFPKPQWSGVDIAGFVYNPTLLGILGDPIRHTTTEDDTVIDFYNDVDMAAGTEDQFRFVHNGKPFTIITGTLFEDVQQGSAVGSTAEGNGIINKNKKWEKVYDFDPKTGKDYHFSGNGVTASDVTGWLGKIGGVISDIFVPGSSFALEAALDNLGEKIDDVIAMKKQATATKAWLKTKRDVSSNTTFNDWQKNQILNIMNQIQLVDSSGGTDANSKVKSLQAKITKLKAGDYHQSDQYKKFKQLVDQTGLDTASKGIIMGWVDQAKNPTNDLTDAERQAYWDNVTAELGKAQRAKMAGEKPMLGDTPTIEQIAAHNAKLEKQAGIKPAGGAIDVSRIVQLRFNRNEWGMGEYFQFSRDLMGFLGPRRFINDNEIAVISYANIDPQEQYYEYTTDVMINGRPLEYTAIMNGPPTGGGRRKGAYMSKVGATRRYNDLIRKINETDNIKVGKGKRKKHKKILVYMPNMKSKVAKTTQAQSKTKKTKKSPGSSDVQSVVFPKDDWDGKIAEMNNWLRKHHYVTVKMDETTTQYRFRQEDPEKFTKFTTKIIDDDTFEKGRKIHLIIGFLKSVESTNNVGDPMKVKSVAFPKDQWNIENSMKWMSENNIKRGELIRDTANTIRYGKPPPKSKTKKIKTLCKDVEISTAGMIIGE